MSYECISLISSCIYTRVCVACLICSLSPSPTQNNMGQPQNNEYPLIRNVSDVYVQCTLFAFGPNLLRCSSYTRFTSHPLALRLRYFGIVHFNGLKFLIYNVPKKMVETNENLRHRANILRTRIVKLCGLGFIEKTHRENGIQYNAKQYSFSTKICPHFILLTQKLRLCTCGA